MLSEGIQPNAITYNALVHASAGGGLKPADDASPRPPTPAPTSPSASPDGLAAGVGVGGTTSDGSRSLPRGSGARRRRGTAGDGAASDVSGASVSRRKGGGSEGGGVGEREEVEGRDGRKAAEMGAPPTGRDGAGGGTGAHGERRWERVMPLVEEMQKAG